MIVLGILIGFVVGYLATTLAIGLWVCLAYAWQPWAVTRPMLSFTENVEGGQP